MMAKRFEDRQKSLKMKKVSKKNLKILILGDSLVGKSALLGQYNWHKFDSKIQSTIVNDLIRKDVEVDGEQVTLEIWDTAGQERFNAICSQFYRGADCVVLVFDTTNSKSFERLEYWRNQFLENGMPSDKSLFPFVVIGNKIDQPRLRQVMPSRAEDWCNRRNYSYFECSAKTAKNVGNAFWKIAQQALIYDYHENPKRYEKSGREVVLYEPKFADDQNAGSKPKRKCC